MKQIKEYTKEEIRDMRESLHEEEFDHLDLGDLREVLWHGCVGWANMTKEEIIENHGLMEN